MYISGLIKKEFGRIKADKRTLVLIFAIPIILIIIFGLTSGGGPTVVYEAAIITRDNEPCDCFNTTSEYDEIFIDIVEDDCSAWNLFDDIETEDEDDYDKAYKKYLKLLKDEVIDVFIVLSDDFSETINNGTQTELICYVDGSDVDAVEGLEVSIQEPIGLFRIEIDKMVNFTTQVPYLEYEVPFWRNQVLNYAFPVISSMLIIGLLMNLTSLSIVSEKPLPRMLITPTAKVEIILSKLIANTIVMILQVTEIFVMSAIFDLYCLGSLFNLYLILLMTGFCGICMGLFISAISKTEQVANQLYIMLFIVVVMFSGAFIRIESLPLTMQLIINSLPLSHSIPLIKDITMKGLPIDFSHFLSLSLISLGFLLIAYIAFSFKKVEV
ncbi:MAG: ABC transporter permease [Promethearchaeota archaeon]|nr:MAG: ABC transporter permease [Candidatus Lokiarchaeota archaeon]